MLEDSNSLQALIFYAPSGAMLCITFVSKVLV